MAIDLNLTPEDDGDGDYLEDLLQRSNLLAVLQAGINVHEFQMLQNQQRNNESANDHRNIHTCFLDNDIMAFDLNMEADDNLDGLASQDQQENLQHQQGDNASAPQYRKYKNLTERQRTEIYAALLARSSHGKLKKRTTKEVAQLFNVRLHQVQAVWRRAKQCLKQGLPINVSSRKTGNCGRKKKEINMSRVSTLPLSIRSTVRSLAAALDVDKSTLHRRYKEGQLRRHSNTLKPHLKEDNKIARLNWCVQMLDQQTLQNEPKFIDMHNIVHIDEKWFYTSKKARKFYLAFRENDPHRTIKNKNAMGKVMFLTAVARPRYDGEGNCIFDGKIGVWPFVKQEPAKRSSRNRAKGTPVTKSIKVDRDTMREFMITKLLPAITARWPCDAAKNTIWIQQDNARPHIKVNDKKFCLAAPQTGLNIRLINQPPNSPDMNVLDLGFFASLQSLTFRRVSKNIDDLIYNVQQEFESYDHGRLNKVFLTLQSCLLEVMIQRGGNAYKIPHLKKKRLEYEGTLPVSLSCDRQLYETVMGFLNRNIA